MNNIKFIKSKADIKAILDYLGVDIIENGDSYRSSCPIHQGSNKSAFDINADTGMWFCHTKCKHGGDIIELVQSVMKISFFDACKLIADVSGFNIDEIKFTKEEVSLYKEAMKWFDAFKEEYKFKEYHLEIQETFPVTSYRDLTKDILEEYGVFFSRDFILSSGRPTHNKVGFPITFQGTIVGVDLRATKSNDNVKWLRQPKGIDCGHTLYNYDKVYESEDNYVIIVEGIIDCLKLVQYGYNVLCTFGASITNRQKQLIEDLGLTVYIAYDGDEAGLHGVDQVFDKLHYTCDIYYIDIPLESDPGMMKADEFKELFDNAKLMRSKL